MEVMLLGENDDYISKRALLLHVQASQDMFDALPLSRCGACSFGHGWDDRDMWGKAWAGFHAADRFTSIMPRENRRRKIKGLGCEKKLRNLWLNLQNFGLRPRRARRPRGGGGFL